MKDDNYQLTDCGKRCWIQMTSFQKTVGEEVTPPPLRSSPDSTAAMPLSSMANAFEDLEKRINNGQQMLHFVWNLIALALLS